MSTVERYWVGPTGYHGGDRLSGDVECSQRPGGLEYEPDGAGGWIPNMPKISAGLMTSIDDFVSAIYSKFTRFDQEYVQREAAARAFKAAGYTGDPTTWVSSFAQSTGQSNQAATDLIIAQAGNLRGALQNLGAQRMRKYTILAAQNPAAAQATYDDIIAQATTIAAALS